MKQTFSLLLALCFAPACQDVPGSHTWEPTLGLDYSIASDYELKLAALGYALETDVDYKVMQFEAGATKVVHAGEKSHKEQFAGIRLGVGSVEEDDSGGSADLWELSGGGRWYADAGTLFIPYFSLWSVLSGFEGVDSPQLGLRLGGGLEYPVDQTFFLRIEADYLYPMLEGADDLGIDVEGNGLALRVGFSAYVP